MSISNLNSNEIEFNKIINKLIDNYPRKSALFLSDWYNYEYTLTLKPLREYLRTEISNNLTWNKLYLAEFDNLLKKRIISNYYNYIKNIENDLKNLPEIIQRSPEWFAFRENLITGSEAGYLLGVKGFASALNAFRGKIGLHNSKPNSESPAIQHGVNYECLAKRIYELRHNVEVYELGCIKSPSPFIGASPDGIVFNTFGQNWDSWSRYGRMLEIKCPYSRIIDDTIKIEYEIQMLQQQYTCHLPICDFLECGIIDNDHKGIPNIIAYNNVDDMLKDTYKPNNNITCQNKNIPIENLSSNGMEKGIAIIAYKEITISQNNHSLQKYKKKEYKTETILYPLEKTYKKRRNYEMD